MMKGDTLFNYIIMKMQLGLSEKEYVLFFFLFEV